MPAQHFPTSDAQAQANELPAVLITGSSGLIGSRLIDALAGDYRVIGLDAKPPPANGKEATFIPCDLTDEESVTSAFAGVRDACGSHLASVVHLAAYYNFSGEPSPLYQRLTVEGTARLLHELRSFRVEQFVFSSTLLLMKPAENDEPLTETSPVAAEWDYPQSKLEAEHVIAQERGGIPAVIVRMAGVYDDDCHSIPLAQHISRIFDKQLESYLFPGDATHGQSYIHLDDAIDCLCRIIELRSALPDEEVLLLGEEDVMSYEELQDAIGLLIHSKEWPTIRIPKILAKAGAWVQDKLASGEDDKPFIKPWMIDLADQHYPVSMRHTREVLGWEPRRALRATLPKMIERLKENPLRWHEENNLPLPEDLARRFHREE